MLQTAQRLGKIAVYNFLIIGLIQVRGLLKFTI